MKVKCTKRYSDVRLNKIIEAGTVLEVDKARADHLVHEGVAEIVKKLKKQQTRERVGDPCISL